MKQPLNMMTFKMLVLKNVNTCYIKNIKSINLPFQMIRADEPVPVSFNFN